MSIFKVGQVWKILDERATSVHPKNEDNTVTITHFDKDGDACFDQNTTIDSVSFLEAIDANRGYIELVTDPDELGVITFHRFMHDKLTEAQYERFVKVVNSGDVEWLEPLENLLAHNWRTPHPATHAGLLDVFSWDETEEGYTYWDEINTELRLTNENL